MLSLTYSKAPDEVCLIALAWADRQDLHTVLLNTKTFPAVELHRNCMMLLAVSRPLEWLDMPEDKKYRHREGKHCHTDS